MKVISEKFGSMDNNCSLIIDEKTNQSALVDCNEFSQKMIDMIGDTDLKYILLTHGHFDHIIGARDTKAKYGAKVVISSEDEPMLHLQSFLLRRFAMLLKMMLRLILLFLTVTKSPLATP